MSRWFRMYADVLDDPKVQRLPPDLFKAWVNLLCLASRNDGVLPGIEDIAFALRMSQDVTRDITRDLSQRGLLDGEDELSPHNWSERQFRSDKDETASERKRRQREREKQPVVTDDVTRDTSVTSRPPEQSRTEQSRAEQTVTRAQDPRHWEEVQGYLKDNLESLTDWEVDFLHSVKWKPNLTTAQADSLKAIRDKLKSTNSGGFALPVVRRGTPAYDAWISYYARKFKGKVGFYQGRDSLTVPTEYPPQEQAA